MCLKPWMNLCAHKLAMMFVFRTYCENKIDQALSCQWYHSLINMALEMRLLENCVREMARIYKEDNA